MTRTWTSKVNDAAIEPVLERPLANPTLKAAIADLLREAADRFILPRFQNLQSQDIATKTSDTDFVTIADQEAESWLAPKLSVLQPGFVIGEEAASLTPAICEHIPFGYGWTIDPLDGTKNFVKGNQTFCSMVALLWNGQPVQSWIWQPLTKTLFYAAEGQGALRIDKNGASSLYLKDRSDDVDLMFGSGNSLGLIEPQKSAFQARLRMLAGRRFTGSAGIQACLIASGDEDFLIHGNSTPWDHAPVDLLCREAGGYAAMLPDESRFHVAMKAPFMAVSSKVGWNRLRDAVWRD
ncbi:inositol monophosphatase [Candidatus Puniceispirillum sp.]|nr:inositol monophosphatase [Alphaproteobacteria bacterium]MDC1294227.1 inositol monophosphatase [Candidatus Puniceispirillum sp.]